MSNSKGPFKPVTHVIFDLDGLLLDSERLYTAATQAFLDQFNITYDFPAKQMIMGKSHREGCADLIKHYNLTCSLDDFVNHLHETFETLFPTAKLMPGAGDLILHFFLNYVPMAVCTGSSKEYYNAKTKKHSDLFRMFNHVVCTPDDEEIKKNKPDPEPFLVTASRFNPNPPKPEKVLVFEDAPNGVTAALAAGMQVVFVPDPRLRGDVLGQATQVLSSLADFKPEQFGLPAL